MGKISEQQIEQLLEDISLIKSVINKNRPLLEQVLMPARFRFLFLAIGLSIVAFCLAVYFLGMRYGGYAGIPGIMKKLLIGCMTADAVFLIVLRCTGALGFLIKSEENPPLRGSLDAFFSSRLIHVFIPLVVLTILLGIYAASRGGAYYIVPTISIGLGLLTNGFGSMTEIRQWLISGYWFLGTGILTLEFPMPTPIAVVVSLGCGLLLFSLLSYFSAASAIEE